MMRRPRPIVAAAATLIIVVSVVLLLLLTTASANTTLFAHNYALLMGLNAVLIVALLLAVIAQLIILRREYRQGVFGSKLKSRLLLMLALMTLLPGVLVYGVSMQFVANSIDSWFDVRVDHALEGGLNLARKVVDGQLVELHDQARDLALTLGDWPEVPTSRLNRLREQLGLQSATLFTANGRLQAHAAALDESHQLIPPLLPSAAQLREGRHGQGASLLEETSDQGLLLRVLFPVIASTGSLEGRVLQVTRRVPSGIAENARSVETAYRDYQELLLGRQGLNHIYMLTLTLTLLLALFVAVWLAMLLAKRIAAPLLILAEGTQAVAAGDFTPRAELATHDELGVLTQSFNRMTRQLSEAREEAEEHRSKVEATRSYLESVLANLFSGVMAFDQQFILRANNRGACAILDDPLDDVDHQPLSAWSRHGAFRDAVLHGFASLTTENTQQWQQQIEVSPAADHGMQNQILLLRGSTLPAASGGGYVLVFDDITQLIAAQRSLAWGEVARRMAHEIKNPLTPIQLSAERLQHKLADKLDADARAMLDRSTHTIVTQVETMKTMVNEFRDYARLPPAQLHALDLNALVADVLALYEHASIRLHTHLATDLPFIAGDAGQLRQVIHNLLKNAEEAGTDSEHSTDLAIPSAPLEITLTTTLEPHGRGVLLTVSDNGCGFPPQILNNAFEPYVTTKARGTGLGLAIVKKIIDEHHGEIRLTNRAGGGAEINIRLLRA